jgi:hypothetical protein
VLGDERLAGAEDAPAGAQPRSIRRPIKPGVRAPETAAMTACLAAGLQRRDERDVAAGQLAGALGDALKHHRVVQRRGELVPDRFERLGLVPAAVALGGRTQPADGHRGLVRDAATQRGLGLPSAGPSRRPTSRAPIASPAWTTGSRPRR